MDPLTLASVDAHGKETREVNDEIRAQQSVVAQQAPTGR